MEEQKLALSLTEAAEMLGCSAGLLGRLARRGDLPTVRLGRRRLIPRKALDGLLSGQSPAMANHSKTERR